MCKTRRLAVARADANRRPWRSLSAAAAISLLATAIALTGPIGSAGAVAAQRPAPAVAVGSAPPIPTGAHAVGATPDSTPLHLVITLPPKNPAALRQAVKLVSTPGSYLYHHFLPTGEFGSLFGASDATIHAVAAGLRSAGFAPGPVSSDRLSIPVDTTVGAASQAFATPIENYQLANGTKAHANTKAPTLPASFAGSVQTVLGLDTVTTAQPAGLAHASSTAAHQAPEATRSTAAQSASLPNACAAAQNTANDYDADTPADYLNAYSAAGLFGAGHQGQGQSIAIFSLQPIDWPDVSTFEQCYGLNNSISDVAVDGGADPEADHGESDLDLETILGIAPGSTTYFYEAPNSDQGWYDNMESIVDTNVAKFISMSYGWCEWDQLHDDSIDGFQNFVDAESYLLSEAALQGQTFVASSGDEGSEGCLRSGHDYLDPEDPATQPYVTAVGGTTLESTSAPPLETTWNNGADGPGASGGGVSNYWWLPDYQPESTYGYDPDGSICGNSGGYCRTVPDVAAEADPDEGGYVVYSDGWNVIGGTSLAAPIWSSLLVDMNSSCPSSIGFGALNPALYYFATNHPQDFNDVTTGNNDYTGDNSGLYPATYGYDLATGLGSPVVSSLSTDLCSLPPNYTADESFIIATFQDFLGGYPTQQSFNYWVDQLSGGASHKTLIDTLANSDQWVANIVTQFYENTLGRAPDGGGLTYWEGIIESGRLSVASVAAQFYASNEYYQNIGGDPQDWVSDLYYKLLERTPDAGGLNYWVGQVARRGRGAVAYAFYQSNESCRDRVTLLYEELLHRQPDSDGLAFWAGRIPQTGDIALAESLALSPEYYSRASWRFP